MHLHVSLHPTKWSSKILSLLSLCIFLTFMVSEKSLRAQGFDLVSIHPELEAVTGYEGSGVSFVDFNGDGWDDISICGQHTGVQLYANNGDETFTPLDSPFGLEAYDIKMITWIDVDNDGDSDAMITCYQGPIRLFERTGEWEFEDITEAAGLSLDEVLSFMHSWADVNRDGYLDLYVSNYNYDDGVTNYFYLNNGDKTFTDINADTPANDGSHFTLASVFMDFNDDGWEDLFVANDRFNSKNHLYKNTEGSFTDISEDSGLNVAILSMSNSWADFDRDGDFDVYISNNPAGNRLEVNQGNESFINEAAERACDVLDFSWAATWIDFDNDGWEDLHVCVEPFWNQPGLDRFLVNEGGQFSNGNSFGFNQAFGTSHAAAYGDFNNDGFADLLVGRYAPNTVALYRNQAVGGHYLKVRCDGVVSNRDGIGCKISAWVGDSLQLRYTHAGEGYLAQYSRSEIFGLGDATLVDSLQVRWPSGIVDTWHNLEADQNLILTEGSSYTPIANNEQDHYFICPGDSLSFAFASGQFLAWSNGSTDSVLVVNEAGTYFPIGSGPMGLVLEGPSFTVDLHELPQLSVELVTPDCVGGANGSIAVSSTSEIGISGWFVDEAWYTAPTASYSAGSYLLGVIDINACRSDTLVELPEPEGLEYTSSIQAGNCTSQGLGSVELSFSGAHGEVGLVWEEDHTSDALPEGEWHFWFIDELGCSGNGNVLVPAPFIMDVSLYVVGETELNQAEAWVEISNGTPPYSVTWSNGSNAESIYDLSPDVYSVSVSDAGGCFWSEAFIVTNLADAPNKQQAEVYPNPFSSELSFKGFTTWVLFDLQGRRVAQGNLNRDERASLDTFGLPAGCYVLQTDLHRQVLIKQ